MNRATRESVSEIHEYRRHIFASATSDDNLCKVKYVCIFNENSFRVGNEKNGAFKGNFSSARSRSPTVAHLGKI